MLVLQLIFVCLPFLLRFGEDVEVADAEEVDAGEHEDDVCVDVLCNAEPVLLVEE